MRICSLLPSATEMIAQPGLIDSLVGVSDECRWPAEIVGKPIVTAARIDPPTLSNFEIDHHRRALRFRRRGGRRARRRNRVAVPRGRRRRGQLLLAAGSTPGG